MIKGGGGRMSKEKWEALLDSAVSEIEYSIKTNIRSQKKSVSIILEMQLGISKKRKR